jgi:hypothetical protein
MARINQTTARFPTTSSRTRADEVAKLNTRPTYNGRLVARVEEIAPGQFAVLVDHVAGKVRKPFGAAAL